MCILACGLLGASPAMAQAAAEEAVILSGNSGTGAAARRMGSNVRGAIGGAADAVASANAARGGGNAASGVGNARGGARGSGNRAGAVPYTIAGNIDALEYFAAPTWRLAGGSVLKVSGTLVPNPGTTCIRNCE